MVSIFFEVYLDKDKKNDSLNEENLLIGINKTPFFKENLAKSNERGVFGRFTIKFNRHKFVITSEDLTYIFSIFQNAIEPILNGNPYRYQLYHLYDNYLTFDFVDCGDTGIRIRHYGSKNYKDEDNWNTIYKSSSEYMIQEIMLPKKEFIIEIVNAIQSHNRYRSALNYVFENGKSEIDLYISNSDNFIFEIKNKYNLV